MRHWLETLLGDACAQLQRGGIIPPGIAIDITLNRGRLANHGDFSTHLALLLAKPAALPARELAQRLLSVMPLPQQRVRAEIAGPGFINFFMSATEFAASVACILDQGDRYGCGTGVKSREIHILVAPPATGPLQIDQGRCVALAASLRNLLRAGGHAVTLEICAGNSRRQAQMQTELAQFDARVDSWLLLPESRSALHTDAESATASMQLVCLPALIERVSGSVVCVCNADPPCEYERLLDGLDADDRQRVELLAVAATRVSGIAPGESTASESTASDSPVSATLQQLCDGPGKDAIRYGCLSRRAGEALHIDAALAARPVDDNPVYHVRYAHARICSVLRQARDKGWQTRPAAVPPVLGETQERQLMTLLDTFPQTIERAAAQREPQLLTGYLQELANGLNKYYEAHNWLIEDESLRQARICLILAAKQVLANGLDLIDVSAPEVL